MIYGMEWKPMGSAPREPDGTIEVHSFWRGGKELIFHARWLASRRIWIDINRPHVELERLKGWRECPTYYRPFTPEEVALLERMHDPKPERLLDPRPFLPPAPDAVESGPVP